MKLDRSIAPGIQEVREVTPFEYSTYKLKDSVPVYHTAHGESNLFKIMVRFDGGIAAEQKPLQAQMAARMMLEGTRQKSAEEIAEVIDFYGASVIPTFERDFISVKIRGLKKDFTPVVELLAELINDSVYPEKQFLQLKKRSLAHFKTSIQRKAYQAQNEMKPLIFGDNHPYGHKTDINAFEQIQLADLQDYYRENIQNGSLRIFISGIEEEIAQPLLQKHFGDMKYSPGKLEDISLRGNERKELHLEDENAVQSAIRLSWKVGNRNHPDFIEMKILNTILGGYFGSRLMKNLREEKGLTYGVGSAIGSAQQTGLWVIATEVGAEYTQTALEEIYREINRLKTTLVGDEELNLVKNYLPGKILRSLEKDFDRLNSFVEMSDHNLPADYYARYLKKVREINAERIRELANQYMMFDDISEVVVGKK
jgi:predicted Zn-dependent peptidase